MQLYNLYLIYTDSSSGVVDAPQLSAGYRAPRCSVIQLPSNSQDTLDDDEIVGGYIYRVTFDGAPTDLFIKVPHRASDSIGTYVTCEEAFEVVQKTKIIKYWAKKQFYPLMS